VSASPEARTESSGERTSRLGARRDDLFARQRVTRIREWWIAFAICASLTMLLGVLIAYTVATGIGVWGNMIPVAWAFGIINFVFWIGIGHAGTFISAILYLLEQKWRTSISRITETMTLFAVVQAGMFPLLHLGRPWFAYWLFPYPDAMNVWPQTKSALPWDAAAVSTYLTVSILFWFVGLVPDFAALRDHASGRWRRIAFGFLSLGWRGSASQWRRWKVAYLMLAGVATPLVVSVHSIVASDFASGNVVGWHSTLMPPFFVAGAIFSGFAMVLTLLVPIRWFFRLEDVITERHLANCAKLMLATGGFVAYGYAIEAFIGWYSGTPEDRYLLEHARPQVVIWWVMVACNVGVPQLLWSRTVRHSAKWLFALSLLVNVGMWSERYVIIVRSLERDYLPSGWGNYGPTWVDIGILAGTFGFFGLLFLAALRLIPFVPVTELTQEENEADAEEGAPCAA
jgi:molybdopterin-containing oxidoreductase family membrane subunit